jgi:hypothetical protein
MERTRLHNLSIRLHDLPMCSSMEGVRLHYLSTTRLRDLSMCSSMEGVRLHNLSTRLHDLIMCSNKECARVHNLSIGLHDLALLLVGRAAWRVAAWLAGAVGIQHKTIIWDTLFDLVLLARPN